MCDASYDRLGERSWSARSRPGRSGVVSVELPLRDLSATIDLDDQRIRTLGRCLDDNRRRGRCRLGLRASRTRRGPRDGTYRRGLLDSQLREHISRRRALRIDTIWITISAQYQLNAPLARGYRKALGLFRRHLKGDGGSVDRLPLRIALDLMPD